MFPLRSGFDYAVLGGSISDFALACLEPPSGVSGLSHINYCDPHQTIEQFSPLSYKSCSCCWCNLQISPCAFLTSHSTASFLAHLSQNHMIHSLSHHTFLSCWSHNLVTTFFHYFSKSIQHSLVNLVSRQMLFMISLKIPFIWFSTTHNSPLFTSNWSDHESVLDC